MIFLVECQRQGTEVQKCRNRGRLPGCAGWEFRGYSRARGRCRSLTPLVGVRLLSQSSEDIYLMALTGSRNAEVAVKCVKRGAADCLPKDRSRATLARSRSAGCQRNNCVTKSVPHSLNCEKLPPASDSSPRPRYYLWGSPDSHSLPGAHQSGGTSAGVPHAGGSLPRS